MPKFLVQISDDYAPEDGDAFDTLVAVLEHFEIPAYVRELKKT